MIEVLLVDGYAKSCTVSGYDYVSLILKES